MWKYAVLVSYLGTHFCGWQKQKDLSKPSVQSALEEAILRMTGETVSVVGSGRTDSGVHSLGQTAHFVLKSKAWDPRILKKGLNSLLPTTIQISEVVPVDLEFHAQRSATQKQYSYYFQQGPCALPHVLPMSWWIQKSLDLEAMAEAAQYLVGEHDFKPFQASGAKPGPTVRRILKAEVQKVNVGFPLETMEGHFFVRVQVVGTGFLKQMVRGIAGTLLQIGEGRRPASCMREILDAGDRNLVGPTAPARALWLERVWYPEKFGLWNSNRELTF